MREDDTGKMQAARGYIDVAAGWRATVRRYAELAQTRAWHPGRAPARVPTRGGEPPG